MNHLPSITISRRGCDRIASGHPWIYRADVEKTGGLQGGELVRVVDGRGWFQGVATYSSTSQISIRLLSRDDLIQDSADAETFFRRRLAEAKALRESLFPGERVWRAVHGEADLIPGLVVDRYDDLLVVQFLTQTAEVLRSMFCRLLTELYAPRAIVERSDAKVRLLEGLELRKGVIQGELPPTVPVREGEVLFELDLLGGQKTGTFLDQRENHLLAGRYASGEGLDCFSYLGGFALQLAQRCSRVRAVEISESAGAEIAANAQRNHLSNVEVVTTNAFDFLKGETESPRRYDTIVLDPPAFAKSKSAIAAAERGYKEINLRAFQLLRPGGILMTASCSYQIADDHFEAIVHAAAADARRSVQVIEKRGASRDHPVLLGMRETRYLKFLALRAL